MVGVVGSSPIAPTNKQHRSASYHRGLFCASGWTRTNESLLTRTPRRARGWSALSGRRPAARGRVPAPTNKPQESASDLRGLFCTSGWTRTNESLLTRTPRRARGWSALSGRRPAARGRVPAPTNKPYREPPGAEAFLCLVADSNQRSWLTRTPRRARGWSAVSGRRPAVGGVESPALTIKPYPETPSTAPRRVCLTVATEHFPGFRSGAVGLI
jgi:hypothetical protein